MCKTTEAISLLRKQSKNPSLDPSFVLRAVEALLVEAIAENQPKTAGLTHERLREVLRYDPKSGHFYWRTGYRRGLQAGTVSKVGYRFIMIDGVRHRAARLAWFYSYKAWPQYEADHKNKRKDDNWIANLRDVPNDVNMRNVNFNNPWGCPGVRETPSGKFVVQFRVGGRMTNFGTYADQYDAVKVCTAQRKAHGVELG